MHGGRMVQSSRVAAKSDEESASKAHSSAAVPLHATCSLRAFHRCSACSNSNSPLTLLMTMAAKTFMGKCWNNGVNNMSTRLTTHAVKKPDNAVQQPGKDKMDGVVLFIITGWVLIVIRPWEHANEDCR
jgi:hypothetical protein